MIALCIIAAVIILILLVPVGVDAEYIGGNIRAAAKICGFSIQLYPAKDGKKEKKKKEKPKKKEKKRASNTFQELVEIEYIYLRV